MTGSPERAHLADELSRVSKRKDSARGHKSEIHSQTATCLAGEQITYQRYSVG